ncbi:MAG: AMP-binding protein, partial [Bacteroidales bacterium]|nr:AMP-binding protein [Bacteroidales bacterium]
EMGKDRQLSKLVSLSKGLRRVGLDLRRVLFKPILSQFGGKLKNILCGGADLDRKYVEGMDDFGIQILVGYGITECAPLVTFNRPGHSRPGSVGVPLNGCEVRISDGEILARSDSVMAGYYKDEEATAQALEGGWLHTGDLGYIDSDGYLYITGRKKNLIILSNGENVSPEELEKLVSTISGVEEVVIREEGKAITAEIYPSEGEDGIREAILQLNRTLPPYKRIQEVRFRNSPFERTTTRKIIRT